MVGVRVIHGRDNWLENICMHIMQDTDDYDDDDDDDDDGDDNDDNDDDDDDGRDGDAHALSRNFRTSRIFLLSLLYLFCPNYRLLPPPHPNCKRPKIWNRKFKIILKQMFFVVF